MLHNAKYYHCWEYKVNIYRSQNGYQCCAALNCKKSIVNNLLNIPPKDSGSMNYTASFYSVIMTEILYTLIKTHMI